MTPMSEELLKRLDLLAAKMGTTGSHLWEVLIREARINGVMNLFWAMASIVAICLFVFRVAPKLIAWDDSFDRAGGLMVLGCLISCALAAFAIVCLICAPGELVNPEFWALDHVINALKQ